MESVLKESLIPVSQSKETPDFLSEVREVTRSSANLFHLLNLSADRKHQLMAQYEELLIDGRGYYWFTETNTKRHASSEIYLYDSEGQFVKRFVLNGQATLYEFPDCIIAACEGVDYKGHVYQIGKTNHQMMNQWTIEGFLWDVEMHQGAVYATSYVPRDDEALIYQLTSQTAVKHSLGFGFYPTSLVKTENVFFLATSYPFSSKKGTVMTLSLNGMKLGEKTAEVAVRELFTYQSDLILHGLDYEEGTAETLTYFNRYTEEKITYTIPKVTHIRQHGQQLLLFNQRTKTMMYWSHERRKIVRVLHWPAAAQLPVLHSPVINH